MVAAKKGGETVAAGFYWNMKDWRMVVVSGDGGVLEGGADERYLRVPTIAMLAAAPVMGLTFVVFLPLVGFVLVGQQIGIRALAATREAAASAADSMDAWKAGEVHFISGARPTTRRKEQAAKRTPAGRKRG